MRRFYALFLCVIGFLTFPQGLLRYNDDVRIKEIQMYYGEEDDFLNKTIFFSYDTEGRLVEVSSEYYGGFIHNLKFTYDEQNRIVKETESDTYKDPSKYRTFEYMTSEAGEKIIVKNYDGDHKQPSSIHKYFNHNRMLLKEESCSTDGEIYHTYTYLYNDDDKLSSMVSQIAESSTTITYEYDAHGRLKKETNPGHYWGTVVTSYEYDAENRLSRIYLKSKLATVHGDMHYDENGNLIKFTRHQSGGGYCVFIWEKGRPNLEIQNRIILERFYLDPTG